MNAVRERLPSRRQSETLDFTCNDDGLQYTLTVAYFDDGRVAELFLSSGKAGSHVDHVAKDAAILVSLALQYGAPVDAIRSALLRDHVGCAVTPIGAALDLLVQRNLA